MIRAIILDLDNTIFPVKSIADELFAGIYNLMDRYSDEVGGTSIAQAKEEMTRRPFQKIADEYGFNEDLTQEATSLLRNLTYNKPIQPFDDYKYVKTLQADKFLVTMGFTKMQSSKVKMLGIGSDFKQVYIADPETTDKTKRHFFADILSKYNYAENEVLVVGDDPESEITEARAIGIQTVLYDPERKYKTTDADHLIVNHRELAELILR
ncbi:HAD family hydrolase [Mucilaginibacter hurinus]|uniref:HAD family hydrolase n=1 Tax=Mucilaginibacter hurinus TaxID=2201324 RepID=A0A367GS87_9SPHI|nr:HAD family hydrolase [Mucilaginibacter hurinus]RCH56304.1 HAD family hydrolase [Mucilaginibacter hurinus]